MSKNFSDKFLDIVNQEIENREYEATCPKCKKRISVHKGLIKCPYCSHEIDVELSNSDL